MPRSTIFNYPHPSKEPRQRSIDLEDLYLTRFTPPWSRPSTLSGNVWRAWVLQQPVAMVCRETLIATLLSLDWKITPRNSKYQEELEPTIRHYTRLFTNGGDYGGLGLDYSGLIEWIAGDLLDTPFGGVAELGRRGNTENGRVMWVRPLDSATMYPTLNADFPAVQMYLQYDAVAFPWWSISRSYISPHSFILKEGWGMAPPEKIYFALELLNRGDKYYANLLLDVPTAGILDLGDMEQSAAEEWINSFKSFVNNEANAFKIPVLYEHNNKIEFIPFGKVPNDIMFNQITLKYAALVAAAYGMSLSDIGLQTTSASGETLAGSIRQERRTKKTGFARMKSKVKSFFDRILPDTLEFNFIDYDDELNVALGRARLADAQAFAAWRQIGLFSPQELRSQAIQDGLVSISLPDELPPDAKPDPIVSPNGEPELMGNPTPPSSGGEGEVKSLDSVSFIPKKSLNKVIEQIVNQVTPKLVEITQSTTDDDLEVVRSIVSESFFSEEDAYEVNSIVANIIKNKSLGSIDLNLVQHLHEEDIIASDVIISDFEETIKLGLSDYIGKTILFTLNDLVFTQSVIGDDGEVQYNNIVQQVQDKMKILLPEYVKSYVGLEFEKLIERIKQEN